MDILNGKVKQMYMQLLTAAVGSALVSCIFAMVDSAMVGQYHGPAGVAALSVFSPIWNIIYSLGILSGIGGAVLFANMRGAGREQEAKQYFTLSVIYGVVLTVIAMVAIALFNEQLFYAFGADEELLHLAKKYLTAIWFAVPCCVFSNILSGYLRNDGNAALAMKAVVISGLFNVAGDYFFVFVMDMGILGAGIATTIGLYISTFIMLTHFISKKNTLHFTKVSDVMHKVWKISATGFPTAVSDLSMGIITVLFNRQIMKYLGTDALAVYGIIAQIAPFIQCCSYGAGQAAQPIISQNFGAKQYGRTNECLRYALITCAVFGVAWTTVVELIPNAFVHIFMTPTEEVLAIAPGIIRTYCISLVLVPFNTFATYYFQALIKPSISLIASLARGAVVSGGMIMILPLIGGPDAIWYTMLVTEIVVAAFCAWQMKKCVKQMGCN